jgi:hypothetical protein
VSRTRTAGAVAAASALLLGLSGCSVVAAFSPHVEAEIYDTAKDLAADKASAIGMPGFIPDDATVIRVDWDTQTGAAILTYTSPTHYKEGTCSGEVPLPKPSIQDSWWPIASLPATALSCSDGWTGFVIGNETFAALPAKKG